MPYSPEPLPTNDIITMLDTYWDTNSGNIPEPTFHDVNDVTSNRVNFRINDVIVVHIDVPTQEEQPIGTWVYGNRRTRLALETYTRVGRQRLYDINKEIRRICHVRMHSETNYQRLQYVSFTELVDAEFQIWIGRTILELVNSAILLEIAT